jgi:FKBP-type peptidyl-prolyl cis-trans isomerase (trigger factor)
MNSKSIKTELKKLPNARVEITVTIDHKEITKYRPTALARLQETLTVDGFRKGHVPEAKIIEKVGETGLLADMADAAFADAYPEVITQTKVMPIGRPSISITKLAPGNDVEYVVTTDVMPTVHIKDAQKIAKEKNNQPLEVVVTDEDIAKAIKEIQQMRAHEKMHQEGIDHQDHNHQNIADEALEELTDEYVKTLGKFENVADFTEKLKGNMAKEKDAHAHEKRRIEILDAIIGAGTFDIPEALVDFELNKMLEQFKYDLAMSGMKIEEYLGHIGKTLEALRDEWREQAVKRVQMQLTLDEIAKEYDIKPEQEKIDEQVKQVMEMYKDQAIEETNVIAYVTQMLGNSAVFDWLENQK